MNLSLWELERSNIHWNYLASALEHYRKTYAYLEVPWMVSSKACEVTLPFTRSAFAVIGDHNPPNCPLGYLVGSAEQSFIELALQDKLIPGGYCALTPCFRDEPVLDELHSRHFAKVELFQLLSPEFSSAPEEIDAMIRAVAQDALAYMQGYIPYGVGLTSLKFERNQEVQHSTEYDILLGGIEVGSYGFRSYEGHSWIYGTGLAEPRFSTALDKACLNYTCGLPIKL